MSNLVEQSSFESQFKPTYLYIKQHSITKKLYFGKTVQDPEKYKGSGKHWKRHVKQHGVEHVETLWYCLFYNEIELKYFALSCSKLWDIVDSEDWANLVEENGINSGGIKGRIVSDETKHKISLSLKGKSKTKEHCEKLSKANIGKVLSNDIKEKIKNSSKHLVGVIDLYTNETCGVTKEEYNQFKGIRFIHTHTGRYLSDKQKEKIREKSTGRLHSEQTKTKISNMKKLVVTVRDLSTGKFVSIAREEFNLLKGIRYVGVRSKLPNH